MGTGRATTAAMVAAEGKGVEVVGDGAGNGARAGLPVGQDKGEHFVASAGNGVVGAKGRVASGSGSLIVRTRTASGGTETMLPQGLSDHLSGLRRISTESGNTGGGGVGAIKSPIRPVRRKVTEGGGGGGGGVGKGGGTPWSTGGGTGVGAVDMHGRRTSSFGMGNPMLEGQGGGGGKGRGWGASLNDLTTDLEAGHTPPRAGGAGGAGEAGGGGGSGGGSGGGGSGAGGGRGGGGTSKMRSGESGESGGVVHFAATDGQRDSSPGSFYGGGGRELDNGRSSNRLGGALRGRWAKVFFVNQQSFERCKKLYVKSIKG
jgi:hypothetical protein